MDLEPRIAVLEWALRAGRGELPGLDWIDTTLRPEGEPFLLVRDGDRVRFRHLPLGPHLPPPLVEAAEQAQAAGEPTALEAVHHLLARAQWLTSARGLLFTPASPLPGLLASLVEAYGVDAELHEADADDLARLVVHLPGWYPRRGGLEPALDLLRTALDHDVTVRPATGGPLAFTCQSTDWWCERPLPTGPLLIHEGFVTTDAGHADVVLGWVPSDRFPHELLRLLPAWASCRLALESP